MEIITKSKFTKLDNDTKFKVHHILPLLNRYLFDTRMASQSSNQESGLNCGGSTGSCPLSIRVALTRRVFIAGLVGICRQGICRGSFWLIVTCRLFLQINLNGIQMLYGSSQYCRAPCLGLCLHTGRSNHSVRTPYDTLNPPQPPKTPRADLSTLRIWS